MLRFCSLFSGSSGNALFLADKNTSLLIDAGISGKRIDQAMRSVGEDPFKLDALLLTHEHSDHSKCIGVMSRRYCLPVYTSKKTWCSASSYLGNIGSDHIHHFTRNKSFRIGDFKITPFDIPHDAVEPSGFFFETQNKKITVATDIGHMNECLFKNISGSDFLFLESNHDLEMLDNGFYPAHLKLRIRGDHGHLGNHLAAETIARLAANGMKRFVLGHLSGENNDPDLAFSTVHDSLKKKGFFHGNNVELFVASRSEPSQVFRI